MRSTRPTSIRSHLQGSAAGRVQAFGRVALAQADELVTLPDSGPGQGAIEEAVGELAHRGGPCSAALRLMPSGALRV